MRVNVFIAGAAKSGTTALAYMLAQHPRVYLSPYKEPFFFELEYDLGFEYYHSRYFPGVNKTHEVVIDARHRNMFLPYVPPRIYRYNPEARIIILIREPVRRAYSHWWMWYVRGLENLSFEEAIAEDLKRIAKYPDLLESPHGERVWTRHFWYRYGKHRILKTYVDSGFYCRQIIRILQFFPPGQILILVAEEFFKNPLATLRRCEEFLGLNLYTYSEDVRQNISLGRIGTKIYDTLRWLAWTHILPGVVVSRAGRVLSNFSHPPKLSGNILETLRKVYQQEITCLQQRFNLDLSSWGYVSNE